LAARKVRNVSRLGTHSFDSNFSPRYLTQLWVPDSHSCRKWRVHNGRGVSVAALGGAKSPLGAAQAVRRAESLRWRHQDPRYLTGTWKSKGGCRCFPFAVGAGARAELSGSRGAERLRCRRQASPLFHAQPPRCSCLETRCSRCHRRTSSPRRALTRPFPTRRTGSISSQFRWLVDTTARSAKSHSRSGCGRDREGRHPFRPYNLSLSPRKRHGSRCCIHPWVATSPRF
jgi:hypothetical protein